MNGNPAVQHGGRTRRYNDVGRFRKAVVVFRAGTLAGLGAMLLAGCFPQESRSIGASDPLANIPAIQDAARDKDYAAVPELVRQLDSDDPAVRFYAIRSLKSLTGQTFDYNYYDDADARKPALRRWQNWLAHRQQTAAAPSEKR